MNYYRRYSGDYLRDTARLNLTEHGAYCLLMDYYYTDEKPLPSEHQELYLMLRAMRPEDRKAVDKVLAMFFTREPDGYHQKRIDHEIEVSKTARGNGKGGGRPKTGTVTGLQTGIETGSITGTQTEYVTEEGGGLGHPPTTNLQPPPSTHQPPPAKPPTNGKSKPVSAAIAPGRTNDVWGSYCQAYKTRYQAEPTRNAKVNGMLGKFLERVPVAEAPEIAAFYVQHNGRFYVQAMHKVDHLLNDAEKLRTEWLTGRRMTSLEAKGAEAGDAVRQQSERVGKLLGVQ